MARETVFSSLTGNYKAGYITYQKLPTKDELRKDIFLVWQSQRLNGQTIDVLEKTTTKLYAALNQIDNFNEKEFFRNQESELLKTYEVAIPESPGPSKNYVSGIEQNKFLTEKLSKPDYKHLVYE